MLRQTEEKSSFRAQQLHQNCGQVCLASLSTGAIPGRWFCTGYTLLCHWDRASVWILEVGSVPGSHILDIPRLTSEPKDKYLSKTEVYIKYVHYKGSDWFCCMLVSLCSYSAL